MKHLSKILLGSLLLSGLLAALSGCVGGYVETGYVGDNVYYGPGYDGPWFGGGAWVDGHRGYGEPRRGGGHDAYISPPRLPSAPHGSAPGRASSPPRKH